MELKKPEILSFHHLRNLLALKSSLLGKRQKSHSSQPFKTSARQNSHAMIILLCDQNHCTLCITPSHMKSNTNPVTSKLIIPAQKGCYCSFTVTLVMQFRGQLGRCHHRRQATLLLSVLLTPPAQSHPLSSALVLVLKAHQKRA